VSIKRYEAGDLEQQGFASRDEFVTYDDHEATIRIKMAEAERNGRAACRLELEWECKSWGMTLDDINQHHTFGDLLRAFVKHITKGVRQ